MINATDYEELRSAIAAMDKLSERELAELSVLRTAIARAEIVGQRIHRMI